jgi:hypothetical protein
MGPGSRPGRCGVCCIDTASPSRGTVCPRFVQTFSLEEGAGNAGCALHPRSRVQSAQRKTHTSIQVQRKHSGIPRAMALRLMPCSPRRRIRLVTVAAGLMASSTRLDRISHRQLDTSNGCQNHTVLPYAAASFVWRAMIAHGKPPCDPPFAPDAAASTASHPNVRDDGQRPLVKG